MSSRIVSLMTWLCTIHVIYGQITPQTTMCGQYENVTDSKAGFTVFTNAWGRDASGSSCVLIKDSITDFTSTWSWGSNESWVHAYPNINLDSVQREPVQMSNIAAINLDMSWGMKPSASQSKDGFDSRGLGGINAKANVALDLFLDANASKAVTTTAPAYEIMVWFGTIGNVVPIGAAATSNPSSRPVQSIGKNKFCAALSANNIPLSTLYQGPNNLGQYVFSFVANTNLTTFSDDVSPLVHYLWRQGFIPPSAFVGVIQFGSEQKHATANVTFGTKVNNLQLEKGTPKPASDSNALAPRASRVVAIFLVFVCIFGL